MFTAEFLSLHSFLSVGQEVVGSGVPVDVARCLDGEVDSREDDDPRGREELVLQRQQQLSLSTRVTCVALS